MRIFVTGTRGIPDIPGGVEKHCQELFQRIAYCGHDIILSVRNSYIYGKNDEWRGVRLIHCFSPRQKSLEAIVHTFLSLLKARKYNPDIVHIHGIGPSLLTPIAKFFGFKIVVTNHGPEYERQKWGYLAKLVLRVGEKIGGTYANEVIVISKIIADIIRRRCKRKSNLIYNGVEVPVVSRKTDFLEKIGVNRKEYILAVARLVPEKGIHDLIEAFKGLNCGQRLVVAGDADHESDYSRNLKKSAADDHRIVLTGYVTGEPLNQLYTHAKLFVLPSYHEGLPIVVLEAMSYGLPVLVSDIPPHKEIDLPESTYFECGNIADLRSKIKKTLGKSITAEELDQQSGLIKEKYCWDKIAGQTIDVYRKVVNEAKIRK